jgi:hypothetical protein
MLTRVATHAIALNRINAYEVVPLAGCEGCADVAPSHR